MSRLEELIQEYCPDGVEYKRFDDVCTLHARIGWQRLTRAEYMPEGNYLLITGTDFTESHEVNYETCVYVTKNRYDQDPKIQIENGDILITKDGTLGKVAQVSNLPMPATLNGGVFVVRPVDDNLLPRFIMYFLLSNHFRDKVFQQKTGSTISHLTQGLFSRLEIPIPPLPVQQEIVRILDSFSKLEQELEQELEQRKKQYAYYNEYLFNTRCAKAEMVKIGDIADITRGRVISKPFIRENQGQYPVYSSQTENNGVLGKIKTYDFDGNYISWTTDGANAGTVFIRSGKFSVTNVCGLIHIIDKDINIRYVYYALSRVTRNYVNAGMGNPKLMSNVMERITIPKPNASTQNEIVNSLDLFSTYCHDLSSGLPAEISLRKKQYEYYRDRLLSFPRKA